MKKQLLMLIILLSIVFMFGQERIDGNERVKLVEEYNILSETTFYMFNNFTNKWSSFKHDVNSMCTETLFYNGKKYYGDLTARDCGSLQIRKYNVDNGDNGEIILLINKYMENGTRKYEIKKDNFNELINFINDEQYSGYVCITEIFGINGHEIFPDYDDIRLGLLDGWRRTKTIWKLYKTKDGKFIRFYPPGPGDILTSNHTRTNRDFRDFTWYYFENTIDEFKQLIIKKEI